METKKDIRKQIFAARKNVTDEQAEAWSRKITERVIALPVFQEAERILAYADYNHEVMTRFLIGGSVEGRQGRGSSQGCRQGYGLLPVKGFC